LLGLKAVTANNGWQYALVGISIVFSGLVILSFVISQLHKVLTLWDNRASILQAMKDKRQAPPPTSGAEAPYVEPPSLAEAKRQYKMLVDRMGEPFALPKLLRLAEKSGLHRPHATLNDLLQADVIRPDKTGYYTWKS
jgi:hypothetical protein